MKRRNAITGRRNTAINLKSLCLLLPVCCCSCINMANSAADAAISGGSVKSAIVSSALESAISSVVGAANDNRKSSPNDNRETQRLQKEQEALRKEGKCPQCKGIGQSPDGKVKCSACNGTGILNDNKKTE